MIVGMSTKSCIGFWEFTIFKFIPRQQHWWCLGIGVVRSGTIISITGSTRSSSTSTSTSASSSSYRVFTIVLNVIIQVHDIRLLTVL